jgi:hypothetical protein
VLAFSIIKLATVYWRCAAKDCAAKVAIFISITYLTGGKMAIKERVSTSKAVKASKPKIALKKALPKKQKDLKAGNQYECGVCGLAVTVEKGANYCDITCCGERMKPSRQGSA